MNNCNPHKEYREQDEWVCPACGCRWGIDDTMPPECKPVTFKQRSKSDVRSTSRPHGCK